MTKKILLYTPTLEGGGAEKVFVHLSNYFSYKGYDVIYLSAYGNAYKELIDPRVIVIQLRTAKPFKRNSLNLLFRLLLMPFFIFKVLRSEKPEYVMSTVHEANLLAFYVHKLFKKEIKLILRMANVYDSRTIPKIIRSRLRNAINNTNTLIANSPDTATSYKSFARNKNLTFEVIGNPAYKSVSENDDIEKTNDNYIIAVGRLEKQKNYFLLLDAFKNVSLDNKKIQLVILGKGTLENDIKEKIKSLGLEDRVTMKGFVKNPNELYNNATAFVLSSDFEGFGNVIIEAMSHGLPVISTNCPGGPNFILNDTRYGELCEPHNPEALAHGILKVLNRPENYSKEAIIKRAKDFSIDKIGEEYLKVIREA